MPNIRKPKEYVEEWKRLWEPDLEAIAFNGATCDPTKVDHKVLDWVKENCAQKPHFIKVINKTAAHGWIGSRDSGSHRQTRLFVPIPFVKEHFKQLGRVTTLENGASHSQWKVSLGTRPKRSMSWLQGWKQLADDNHLQPGDVMIFVLIGDSHFEFHLFDEDGHPKRAPQSNHTTAAVETEPGTGTSHHNYNHNQNDSFTDAELAQDPFRSLSLKKRRLFDPDILSIAVKSEPGIEHDRDDVHEPQIAEPDVAPVAVPEINPDHTDTGRMLTAVSKRMSTAASRAWPSKQSVAGSDESVIGKENLVATECATAKRTSMKEGVMARGTRDVVSVSGHGHQAPVPVQVCELPFDPLAMCVTSRRRVPTIVERIRAREVALAHADVLVGVCFVVVLAEHHVYRGFRVSLSQQFVTKSKLPKSRTRLCVVDAATGKSWPMYSEMTSASGLVTFDRRYWGVFSLQHFLEEGDVLVFQLKSKEPRTISVRIFRVLQLPKEGRNTRHLEASIHDHYDIQVQD